MSLSRSSIIEFVIFTIIIAVFFASVFRDLIGLGVYHWADVIQFPPDAKELFDFFFSSWRSERLGYPYFAPNYYFIQGVLLAIFRDAALAQKIYYLYPTAFAAVTMYLLLGRFVHSFTAKLVGSLVFAVNPYGAGIANLGGIFFFGKALTPLLILYLFKIMEDKNRLRNLLIFTIILGAILSSQMEHFFALIPLVLPIVLITAFVRRSAKLGASTIGLLLASSSYAVLLTLPWSAGFLKVHFFEGAVQQYTQYYVPQFLAKRLAVTYHQANLANLLRILGSPGAHGWPEFGYYSGDWWTSLGFVIPILAFSALILSKGGKIREYTITFSGTALLMIGFLWLIHLEILTPLFMAIPELYVYQNPGVIMPLLPLAYGVLVAITVQELLARMDSSVTERAGGHYEC